MDSLINLYTTEPDRTVHNTTLVQGAVQTLIEVEQVLRGLPSLLRDGLRELSESCLKEGLNPTPLLLELHSVHQLHPTLDGEQLRDMALCVLHGIVHEELTFAQAVHQAGYTLDSLIEWRRRQRIAIGKSRSSSAQGSGAVMEGVQQRVQHSSTSSSARSLQQATEATERRRRSRSRATPSSTFSRPCPFRC